MRNRAIDWLLRVFVVVLVAIGIAGYFAVLWERVPPFRKEWAIAFESNRNGNDNDLFLYQNGRIRQLVENDEYDGAISWSPGGAAMVFEGYIDPAQVSTSSSFARSNLEIWQVDAGGGELTALTNHPANDSQPAWSPDGNSVAFLSNRNEPETASVDVYVLEMATGDLIRVTPDAGNISRLSWAPDGRRIAFSYLPVSEYGNGRGLQVYIADLNTRPPKLTAITAHGDSTQHTLPRFSPDGNYLTFLSNNGNHQSIVIHNLETGEQYPLLPSTFRLTENGVWSPDGRRFALSAASGTSMFGRDIHVIDMGEIESGVLKVEIVISNPRNNILPVWSPDGSQLAYVHDQRQTGRFVYAGKCEIMVYDLPTGVQYRLAAVQEGICDNRPMWRPE